MAELGKKVFHGSVFLMGRQLAVNGVNFFGNLMLARILFPEDFGIYAILLFVLNFLALIGEGGLGAALIRKPGEVDKKELSVVFTFQQTVMGALSLLMLLATFMLRGFINNPEVLVLFQVSIISYFILSFRTIPVILLQRKLLFGRISLLEIAEVMAFQATAVILAVMGKGVWALIFGLLAKNAVSVILLFFISPWKPEYRIDWGIIKKHLPFGASIQGIHFVNLIKDSTVPVWAGSVLGAASVGFITWAAAISNYPVLASNIVSRVLFPMFSRLQEDRERLKSAIELVLRINVFFVFGLSAVLWGFAEPITVILYTEKWMPALVLFNFFIPVNILSAVTGPLISLNNATGNAGYNLRFSILWAVLLWFFCIIFVPIFGIIGFGMASLLTTLVNIKYFYDAAKKYEIRILACILLPLSACVVLGAGYRLMAGYFAITGLLPLIIAVIAGLLIYAAVSFLLSRNVYIKDIKFIKEKVFKK